MTARQGAAQGRGLRRLKKPPLRADSVAVNAHEIRSLRYPATCVGCGADLPAKARAAWDKERRQATCEPCVTTTIGVALTAPPIDRGRPGASALREGRRRQERREAGINRAHPRLGKVILALTDEPQSTRSWQSGGKAEGELGEALERLREEGLGVLHDRRIPGSKANIDHLVIGPAGLFVIDTKRYSGKIERRDRGWALDRNWRLYVNGRDKTRLVEAMPRQVDAVRQALASTTLPDCVITAALCFVDSHWGIGASPFVINEVRVLWPNMLSKLVRSEGTLNRAQIAELERALAFALPGA